jgi:hypothetical protein
MRNETEVRSALKAIRTIKMDDNDKALDGEVSALYWVLGEPNNLDAVLKMLPEMHKHLARRQREIMDIVQTLQVA